MMLKTPTGKTEWLEFSLLQDFPLLHRVTIKGNDMSPVTARQVHGADIVKIPQDRELIGDALITREKNLPIGVRHADCQGAVIYDPVRHALAVVHSGWRGSALNIYRKSIESMQSEFDSKPADLIVCVGPSLGPGHAEFIHYKTELPEEFWEHQIKPNHFDFWEITKRQILECGILEHHLEIAKICTFEDTRFHSYRRDKTQKRHMTIAALL